MANNSAIECRALTEQEIPAWDHYVSEHSDSTIYHFSIWRHILREAFGKRWYALGMIRNGEVLAGIPLVHMNTPLFGNFLVSMPYVNYGGFLLGPECPPESLMEGVNQLGEQLQVDHIELRHMRTHDLELPAKTDKVSMWLSLPDSSELLLKSFKPKLRSQVRKGEKNGLIARSGSGELLDDFYSVFSQNMRDLGTPVYGKSFFRMILESFPKTARLVVTFDPQSRPIAAGFLLGYRDRLEIPWASSLRSYNHLQSNMFLYWNCLKFACEEGYRIFDFGRSTSDGPTFKFKQQWGAESIPHYWHYVLRKTQNLPQINPHNPKYRLAITCWQRIPVWLTQWIGPTIAKHLP